MRMLLISILAGALTGCSCLAPQQALMDWCADAKGFGCFNKIAASSEIEPKRAASKVGPVAIKAKAGSIANAANSRIASRAAASKAGPLTKKAKAAFAAKAADPQNELQPVSPRVGGLTKLPVDAAATKTEGPASAHVGGASDPIIEKAKTTVAAKMEDPPSAESVEMKRALRKNTLGQPIDTICGHVKAKTAASGDNREMAFPYLVKEDEVYIVGGREDTMAAAAYGNICNHASLLAR